MRTAHKLVDKLGEGMTRLVYLPCGDSQIVFKVELNFKRDGTPETLTNQAEVDIMKKVPEKWRLGFRTEVEDINIFSKWDEPHSATMMLVERFEKDLMAEVSNRLEKKAYPELAHLMRMAIHTVLHMAASGITISDISLCNLCYHKGLVKVADWGCGYVNAGIPKLRASFRKNVQNVARAVGPDKMDLEPILRVDSACYGNVLDTPPIRNALDRVAPFAVPISIPAATLRSAAAAVAAQQEESSDDEGRSTASEKTKAEPWGRDPWVSDEDEDVESTATDVVHPVGSTSGAGGKWGITEGAGPANAAGTSSSMLRSWSDEVITPATNTRDGASSHLYSNDPCCTAARPKSAALGNPSAPATAPQGTSSVSEPSPPPPGCVHMATQTDSNICGVMVDEDVDFNMWEGPTVTDIHAHIRMCRYIEWQQKYKQSKRNLLNGACRRRTSED